MEEEPKDVMVLAAIAEGKTDEKKIVYFVPKDKNTLELPSMASKPKLTILFFP